MKKRHLSDNEIKKLVNNKKATEQMISRISDLSWREISEIPDLSLSYIHHFDKYMDMKEVFRYNENISIKFIKRYWDEENIIMMLKYNKNVSKNVFEYSVLHLSTEVLDDFISILSHPIFYDIIKNAEGSYSNIDEVWKLVFRNPNLSQTSRLFYDKKIKELFNSDIPYYIGMKVHSIYYPNSKLIISGKCDNRFICINLDQDQGKDFRVSIRGTEELISGWADDIEEV